MILLLVGAGEALGGWSSCPQSVGIFPFPSLDLARFDVTVTDGAPGDLDGVQNGVCEFGLTLCFGAGAGAPCPPEPVESYHLKVKWGPSRAFTDAVAAQILGSVASMPGAQLDLTRALATFGSPRAISNACVQRRVRMPSDANKRRQKIMLRSKVRVVDTVPPRNRRGQVTLRCLPAPTEPGVDTAPICTSKKTDCTDLAFVPTDPPPAVVSRTPTPTPTAAVGASAPPAPTATAPPPPAPTATPPWIGNGTRYYLSPSGNDSNSGKSAGSPWRTFGRVFNSDKILRPGDVLILLDGTYTRATTGLPTIRCSTNGNARDGTATAPITIMAQNERRAFLFSDGHDAGFDMYDCSWWNVYGLRAASADNSDGVQTDGYPFRFKRVSRVRGWRLLGSHNNRMHNTHVFAVENSSHVLLEECEAYYFHRHAFSLWQSRFVTLRRCYANSMLYGELNCCGEIDNRDYGDSAFTIYGSSDSIVENCISENHANGYRVEGIANPLDPSGRGGRRNKFLGSISFEDNLPAVVASRATGPTTYYNARDNLFRDFISAKMSTNGLYLRDASDNIVENATLFSSVVNSGLVADQSTGSAGGTCSTTLVCATTGNSCSSNSNCGSGDVCTRNPDGCSFTAQNVLSFGNAWGGVSATDQRSWLVEHSNAALNGKYNFGIDEDITDGIGFIRRSLSVAPSKVGLDTGQCLLWIPDDSNMKTAGKGGGPIGATILYRYKDGQLTTQRLWDPVSGAFPCGAVVSGINDGSKRCTNIHQRLNVNRNGCQFPAGY